MIYKSWCS